MYAQKMCIGKTCITSFKPTCRLVNSGWKLGASKENRFLDRLHISCGDNEYMKSYKLHAKGQQMKAEISCCKLPGL